MSASNNVLPNPDLSLGILSMSSEVTSLILFCNREILAWRNVCLSFAALYSAFSFKSPCSLATSIAFGISVDDTIHFLAKYRQELQDNKWQIKKSVYNAIKETGISMFYTSVVLFFGFSVFIISNFGGTVALGALVSATLLLAMLSNLLLLPSMLLSLERSVANEKVLKKPKIKILTDEEELLN